MNMYEHTCLGECVHARIPQLMNIMNMYELELLEHTCLGECVQTGILQHVLTYEQYEYV